MRLGMLGGTFDPVHLGHLRAAESAREALELDRVLLMPAGAPPHKPSPQASRFDRFAMAALAAAGYPAIVASSLELEREGPSYTVDTVRALRGPETRAFLIVGSDTWPEMAAWREAKALLEEIGLAVVGRPGEAAPAGPDCALGVRLIEEPGLPISASDLRRRAAQGRSLRGLVPDAVADYIQKRGLYR
ncbi:MAG: nicotinate-nucleotide adenylyltransferase [Vicinamibacteria bacterium]